MRRTVTCGDGNEVEMSEPPTALIVGAGVGGLAAGIALQRAGWTIRIYERASHPRELGFGLVLAANALSALRELGVAEAIVAAGVTTDSIEFRRVDGRVVRRFDGQLGGPTLVALRSVLHGALLGAVGGDVLHLASEAATCRTHAAGVTLTLSNGKTDTGDVLIGADGVSSMVRKQLHPTEPPPRPSGFCSLRGVAHGVTEYLRDLGGVAYFDEGLEAATVRASRDAVYWYLSLLSCDVPDEVRAPQTILDQRSTRFERPLQAILSATHQEDMRFDVLFQRDPLPAWGSGRITLLGDAAHPVLPHTGQGAALALEDAVALALALSGSGAIDARLRRYEAVRARRTRRFMKLGPRIARVTTTRSVFTQTLRSLAIRLMPEVLIRWSATNLQHDPHRALRSRAAV
jgi:2-polyprenyl-6-methoxyphenol hydroxylase-like FAD-dependent oxidoreductase